jgi:mRNA-degrading endonuclease toxin of MazEF toxin-antitoxin module
MVGDADRLRAVSKVFLKFWSAADKQRPALPITRSRAEGCRRAAIPATGGRAHPLAIEVGRQAGRDLTSETMQPRKAV